MMNGTRNNKKKMCKGSPSYWRTNTREIHSYNDEETEKEREVNNCDERSRKIDAWLNEAIMQLFFFRALHILKLFSSSFKNKAERILNAKKKNKNLSTRKTN